ncbi:MAG: hypothetical protein JJE25_08910 [Bacteroidia bacterium]|nr:hypothetical protein [Bacteroidia bacterium]
MDNKSSNRVNMIRTTHDFCNANPAPVVGIPAFALVLVTVGSKLVLINGLDQIAMGTTTGVTLDTNALRFTMTNIAEKCANALSAYADSVSNNTLLSKINYTKAKLDKLKKDEVDDVCQTIHDEADTNIAAAGAFGYDAGDVGDLQTSIDLYRASIQSPSQARLSISDAKKQIKSNIDSTIKSLLKK